MFLVKKKLVRKYPLNKNLIFFAGIIAFTKTNQIWFSRSPQIRQNQQHSHTNNNMIIGNRFKYAIWFLWLLTFHGFCIFTCNNNWSSQRHQEWNQKQRIWNNEIKQTHHDLSNNLKPDIVWHAIHTHRVHDFLWFYLKSRTVFFLKKK